MNGVLVTSASNHNTRATTDTYAYPAISCLSLLIPMRRRPNQTQNPSQTTHFSQAGTWSQSSSINR